LSIPPSVLDPILLSGTDPSLTYRNCDILEIPVLIKHTPERLYTPKLCFPRFVKRLKAIEFSGVRVNDARERGWLTRSIPSHWHLPDRQRYRERLGSALYSIHIGWNSLCKLATLASPSAPPAPEFESAEVSDLVGHPVSAMYDLGLFGAVAATAYIVSDKSSS
jgi:hypothetical protein